MKEKNKSRVESVILAIASITICALWAIWVDSLDYEQFQNVGIVLLVIGVVLFLSGLLACLMKIVEAHK